MPSQTVWISLILLGALILAVLVIREVIASDKRKAQAAQDHAESAVDAAASNIRKPNRKRDRKSPTEQS